MDLVHKFALALGQVFLELSPWLMFGLLLAGVLHVLLPTGFIARHLGGRRFVNVFKAVAVGVPLPLCSCGVIPTAIGLKRDGASDGAATGFLISTPQTGVDSILVSATFLGWPFAIFKVLSALISGLIGGLLVNAFDGRDGADTVAGPVVPTNAPGNSQRHWSEIITFGLIKLLRDIYRWLIVGIVVAALISTFIPAGRLETMAWTQGLAGMLIMLVVSLPMYVCATASVPMAASLVVAGMSPGAALVLLMAGPTTNVATIGTIYRSFGKKVLAVYLGTVIVMSISMGMLFDGLLADVPAATEHMHTLPGWLQIVAALALGILMLSFAGKDLYKRFWAKGAASCCSHDQGDVPPAVEASSGCCSKGAS